MSEKLDNDYESVRNQTLTNPNIPTVVELIGRLIWVASSEVDSQTTSKSFVFVSNSFC